MGILIDASILIEHERRGADLDERLRERPEREPAFLSVVTASELLHGVHRAKVAALQERRRTWVEALLNRLPVLPIDLETARRHSEIWAELASRGEVIGPHDLWIAAACISHDLTLATGNVREFERVVGLRIDLWD